MRRPGCPCWERWGEPWHGGDGGNEGGPFQNRRKWVGGLIGERLDQAFSLDGRKLLTLGAHPDVF